MTLASPPQLPTRGRGLLVSLVALATGLEGCGEGAPTPPAEIATLSPAERAGRDETLALARELLHRGALDEARARLAAHTADHGEDGAVLALLTEVLCAEGDVDGALKAGERAIELAPDSCDAHVQYSRALGLEMQSAGMLGAVRTLGRYKEVLHRARELDPSNLDARTDEILFYLVAPGIAGGSHAKARALATEMTALDRDRGLPLLVWAISVDEDPAAAIAFCMKELQKTPDHRPLHLSLARLLGDEERVEEAVPHFETVLAGEKDRDYYDALYQLARLRVRAGVDAEKAIQALEEYASDAPVYPGLPSAAAARWRIGNAYELLSDADAARAAYESALSLDPTFERATEALEALD